MLNFASFFLVVSSVGLRSVIVVFPGHTYFLKFFSLIKIQTVSIVHTHVRVREIRLFQGQGNVRGFQDMSMKFKFLLECW